MGALRLQKLPESAAISRLGEIPLGQVKSTNPIPWLLHLLTLGAFHLKKKGLSYKDVFYEQ